jgi:hypothetical protein
MKRLIALLIIFCSTGLIFMALAQDQPSLKIVHLNQEDALLALQPQIVLIPGDTLQFVADSGEFAMFIQDAVNFLKIKESDLQIHLDSASNNESNLFIVRKVETDIKVSYSIYCISGDSWPAAPPRIIIVSH